MSFVKRAASIKNSANINIYLCVFLSASLLLSATYPASAKSISKNKAKKSSGITAQSVYAIDYTNNKVIYSKNSKSRFQPASTVKLLTALVVLDKLALDSQVRIGRNAINVEPTKAGLTLGAKYSVKELLEVLLATSANDAGVALACAVSGSEAKFALLMNKKARALGCKNSNFSNSTGLPNKKQYTTAFDLSIITRAAFSQPFIASTMKKKQVKIEGTDGKTIVRNNHNKMLWKFSETCVLGKTGYTRTAGHCYAGVAYFDKRNISVVIMKSRKPWADLTAILGLPSKKG